MSTATRRLLVRASLAMLCALLAAFLLFEVCDRVILSDWSGLGVVGDVSAVGATVLVDGRQLGILRASRRDTSIHELESAAEFQRRYQQWLAHRDSARLGTGEEFRISLGSVRRVLENGMGREQLGAEASEGDMMVLDSIAANAYFNTAFALDSRWGQRHHYIVLISVSGESLGTDMHPLYYNHVRASFSQRRIEAYSETD